VKLLLYEQGNCGFHKELSDFGVDARYPGDMFIPDEDETLAYKNLAFEIKDLVESKIWNIINK
jgi:hypothetical protein